MAHHEDDRTSSGPVSQQAYPPCQATPSPAPSGGILTHNFQNHEANIMRMFQFQLHPLTPVEHYEYVDDNTVPSSPSSSQSSPESCDYPSKGGSRWQNGRRRGNAPRNIEQRPYHSPNHVSPPHDKPMTKNDIYFALDCEVSRQFQLAKLVFCCRLSRSHNTAFLQLLFISFP